MPRAFFRRLLPDPGAVRNNRFVRWLGPWIQHPRLWHVDRRGIALGFAVGLFFGLMVPVAQILFAALFAVLLRANLPVAVVSTLVTNPFTFGPIYFLAYRLGTLLLGETPAPVSETDLQADVDATVTGAVAYARFVIEQVSLLGKPLLLGLLVLAVSAALLGYALITLLWRVHVSVRWRRRNGRRPG
jgi:uncharacterized protein (DUF2062 family)